MQAMRIEAQSFGATRSIHAQVDAATQADLVGYESEDERMGRRRTKRCAPPFSKVDIREQYCISKKQVQVLESNSPSALFGCLSKHHDSSCHSKHSILTKCVDRAPSDENIHESSRQPLPRRPMEDLERAYLRRRPKSMCGVDPRRYAWIPEDEEPCRMEHARSVVPEQELLISNHEYPLSLSSEHIATTCPAHYLPPPPPPPAGAARIKHVSFARSHTLTSFDDAIMELRRTPTPVFKSQERLILSTQSGKRVGPPMYQTYEQRSTKKPPMKTQATQTGCVGKEPPNYLSLSPRTVHRVRMISQGAQTNGQLCNGRKLMKSYSEAGGYHFGGEGAAVDKKDHDLLTRTQSEEPRSPYMKNSNLPWAPECTRNHQETAKQRSARVYKEIFIDFEPADVGKRSRQSFTQSDGEFISDYSLEDLAEVVVDRVDGVKVSLSSYSSVHEEEVQTGDLPDRHPGLHKPQDSMDEEFHENLIYGGMFHKQPSMESDTCQRNEIASGKSTPELPESIPTQPLNTLTVSRRVSPFASNDSLTIDHRADHSDGNWNESQSTVLHAESDSGNGRPTSKKHLLMLQHQQRSSIDTEALEDDYMQSQSSIFSPLKDSKVPSVTIATVHYESPSTATKECSRSVKGTTLSPAMRETRRKIVKSPDKETDVIKTQQCQRRDSGRITDISETSTTEDYATAHDNSGEDTVSSRHPQGSSKAGSKEGSSFESASSLPGNAKEESSFQIVPSSPPPIQEENISDVTEVEERKPEYKEDTASVESSSSGSYSLESCQKDPKEWTDQERSWAKKGFKLDLSDQSVEQEGNEEKSCCGQTNLPTSPKKAKTKQASSRKTQQGQVKKWNSKGEDITPGMVRSPAMPDGFRGEDWAPPQRTTPSQTPEEVFPTKTEIIISSDESSCEYKNTGIEETINGHSPRRQRKRGGGRGRKAQETGRVRRPLAPLNPQPLAPPQQQQQLTATVYCRSPSHSPKGSPRKPAKGTKATDRKKNEDTLGGHLKAVSAESLRSVSPGSDSVFYNEGETHHLCHQCGREVEPEPDGSKTKKDPCNDIVQPPPRFADSPEGSHGKTHRIFKKQEKRFRSEERSGERRRHHRNRTDGLRAKSEERGKEKRSKDKLRPHAHSTDASMELLRGADSSPSISDPFTEDDQRIYADAFKKASWISIVEEAHKVLNPDEASKRQRIEAKDDSSAELSPTEKEFKRKFQAATHRMVHRKSSMDMYRRMQDKTFGSVNLRERLEEILRLMLVVWCTQKKALSTLRAECDKKVLVKRQSGEFGFRIHGSRPVVVSAIEPDTPAESSGLEVGDIVLSVNGISVLEASHSDVVKLAHSGSDTLELEIARTLATLISSPVSSQEAVKSGFLNKLGVDAGWHERWFVLRADNCLYYYNSKAERQPLGALLLINYKFSLLPESSRSNSFSISKQGAKTLELSANTAEELEKWKNALEAAMAVEVSKQGLWFEKSCQFLQKPAASVEQPDCFGHLTQLEDKWRRRYCVLKDAALLMYTDSAAQKALAVACLQGYRVQSAGTTTKRFSFEVVPPESKQKHFYFYTDTEMDKKRWIAAIEFSIDRWMKVG